MTSPRHEQSQAERYLTSAIEAACDEQPPPSMQMLAERVVEGQENGGAICAELEGELRATAVQLAQEARYFYRGQKRAIALDNAGRDLTGERFGFIPNTPDDIARGAIAECEQISTTSEALVHAIRLYAERVKAGMED